jgi:hypothetical protein
MDCSPMADVIQTCWLFLPQLCCRRIFEICWTTWAVATPGAEGVGRLTSRSKWGRYRPKGFFFLASLRFPVTGYCVGFLRLILSTEQKSEWKTR